MERLALFWFRRDLRLHDNTGLFHALGEQQNVLPLFIFDTGILDRLSQKDDARVNFIYELVSALRSGLMEKGGSLLVKHGKPVDVFREILKQYEVSAVYTNHDYEPAAIRRDKEVSSFLRARNVDFRTFKDQCIFEKNEVLKGDGKPYTVFTPYMRAWKREFKKEVLEATSGTPEWKNLYSCMTQEILPLKEIGFAPSEIKVPEAVVSEERLKNYHQHRDFPAIEGTSHVSVHLRFGTLSIRELVKKALQYSETWLNELIWREFFMMILWYFPYVVERSFKPKYDRIKWRNNEAEFDRWCKGNTGYPIVDAGMRELNTTGFMHNRVRMITASFLVKHLLVDWRWGEAYFAEKLLDFELSSNNGGWQWAAGSGCDAAPYFRVFNPALQTKKFDPDLKYIRKWVPEFQELTYPAPVVEHSMARERALDTYKEALS